MINTVDFITPPVDDPYWFGQISAADSISDVYSMGGKPLTALNVVMFPSKQLDDMGILKDILSGGGTEEELLYTPQTSGGLILSVPNGQADELITALHNTGVSTAVKIGEVSDGQVGLAVE